MGLKKTFGRLFGFGKNDEEILEVTEEKNDEAAEELDGIIEDAVEDIAEKAEDFAEEVKEKADELIDDIEEFIGDDKEEISEPEAAEEDAAEGISSEPEAAAVEEPVSETEPEEAEEAVAEDAQETLVAEITEEPADAEEAVTAEVSAEPEEAVVSEKIIEKTKQKIGFFAKLKSGLEKTRKSFNDKIDSVLKAFRIVDEDLFEELEEALIMADVGVETSLYIISQLRERVKSDRIKEPSEVKGAIEEIIAEILSENDTTMKLETTPSVIMVIGVNGVGKTTSIGKMAARYKAEGKKVVIGAADTFRAAAIDQLQIWADRSGIDLIKHQEGSDPAAVVFDTISAAKARNADVIILDTAGRLHNKKNLMDELSKIFRVMERELPGCSKETLLVLDATTGQNAVNQVKLFRESADISGIILTKLDGSAKGGIVLAIAHEEKIPVKLVGVGEGIEDLQVFNADDFAKALFAE